MVEWKTIKDICNSLPKAIIKQGDLTDAGRYPVINSGISLYGYFNEHNNEGNAFTFASRGEYAGFLTYLSEPFWAGGLCYPYRSKNENSWLTKYIYEYLKSKEQYIMDTLVMRGGIPALNKIDVEKIQIPIPSLSEQSRIVGILDTFTASIANLKEQIGERRKQYEHYRDHLLDSVIEKKALRDIIVRSCTGATPLKSKKEYYENGAIPWLRTQEVCFNEIVCTECFITEEALHKTSVKWIPANSIIVAISGATAGRCAINKIPLTTNQHCLCLEINEKKALYKFVYYCICKQKDELIGKKEGARGDLNTSKVLSLQIAYPSLEEQSRIVSILDQFEASIANLEAQLQEREKQYEHYRNQLLTFE